MKFQTLLAVLGASVISIAAAAPVAITNHSFEDQVQTRNGNPANQTSGSDDWTVHLLPTGWTDFDDGRNDGNNANRGIVSHATDSFFNSSLATTPERDANDQSFFSAEKDIYQVLGATLQADTTYTLKIDIGDRAFAGPGGEPGNPEIHLGYGATPQANYLITLENSTQPTQIDGGWITWSGQFTTGASPAGLGEVLRIELANGTNVGWFDNVRLTTGDEGGDLPSGILSIDVGNNAVLVGSELVGAAAAAQPAESWVDATAANDGTASAEGGILITWDGNFYGTASNGTIDQNHTIMNGMMGMNAVGSTFLRVAGLGAPFTSGGYDVYVYVASDSPRTHGLTGSDNEANNVDVESVSTSAGQFLTDGGDYELTPSYVVLSGFTGSEFTLTRGLTGGVPQITGIQIVASSSGALPFAVEIDSVGNDLAFSWPSKSGKVYDLLGTTDPEADGDPSTWTPVAGQEDIAATPGTNNLTIPRPADDTTFYAVRERDPSPSSGPITVILMAGQSNMLGSGTVVTDLPVALQSPQTDIRFSYGGAAGSISGLTSLQPGSGLEFGPEITFGRTVADADPSEEFALIKYGDSGSDLENNWDPTGGSSHSAFVARVTAGMNALTMAGYTPTISAMLWTQGERDARQGYGASYEANLNSFITDIRTRYGTDLPFFISQLSSLQTDLPSVGLAEVRQAQANVAADANSHLIVTDSFDMRTDNLHFSSAGQVSLGQAFAASYQAEVGP